MINVALRRLGRQRWSSIVGLGGLVLAVVVGGLGFAPQRARAQVIPTLFAQNFDNLFPSTSGGGEESGPLIDIDTWPVKVFLIVLALIIATVVGFLFLFPWLLKQRRTWPLTAYGIALAFTLTVTFGITLWAFWDELVMGGDVTPKPFLDVWGGRIIVTGAWAFVNALVLNHFRSPHSRKRAIPNAKKAAA